MSPDVLKELRLQSSYPRGIAARIDSADLKRLLEERQALLDALAELADHIDEETDVDDGSDGHPRPNWAMRLCNRFGEQTNAALTRAGSP